MAKISKAFLRIKVFIDSDVVISSLLSQTGASNIILNNSDLRTFISNFSQEELNRIVDRLGIDKNKLKGLLKSGLKTIKVKLSKKEIIDEFGKYAYDTEDAHIVAGTTTAKAKILVTFNTKDYKIKEIQQDFDIRVMRPGELLQYLRSLE